MADLPNQARVVVIGGGAVGVSCLYHLAKAGWHDALLLEKNELTSGSTWHAAGNVPTFSTSWSLMNMQRYSSELYRGLGEAVDYPMNYHVTGSLRLAHSPSRMLEFQRAKAMGQYQGMKLDAIGVDEIKSRYPFLETHDLLGALYDPADGDIDPAQLTQALAKGARQMGASIVRFCEVTGLNRRGEEWIVKTNLGEVRCEIVVNAAGYYAGKLAELFYPFGGRRLPMMVMSHQYLLTEPIPELEAWSRSQGHKLPLLRDVDVSYYLRQEKYGFNLGPYERNCRAHWWQENDPIPNDFSFQLFPDDVDRLENYISDAMARVPILQKAGIAKVINGPIPYAPDGNPLIGPMPGVRNAYEACVFTFGIAQAGGAGKVLAEWVTEGQTEWDMWSCDPRRFTAYADHDYCVAKGMEVYGHEYAIHFPHHRWPAAPNKRQSPLHQRLSQLGAQFAPYNGWERAEYYAKDGDDLSEEATLTFNRSGPWEPRVKEECLAVRDGVGVLDLCGFSRYRLQGKGAASWLLGKITGRLPAQGRLGLGYFADKRGRLVTEMSLFHHAEDEFTLITAAVAEWHDEEWLRQDLPKSLVLENISQDYECLIIAGPHSRNLLAKIGEADLTLPWLSLQQATIATKPTLLARVSFAGELGWEIHAHTRDISAIYEKVLAGGAKPFGMIALNSLRIEKGYRAWKQDLSSDYSVLELGLERFVDWDKPQGFVGKEALRQEKLAGSRKKFCSLILETSDYDAPTMANVWQGGQVIGEVTSGAYGYRIEQAIGLAMLKSDFVVAGAEVEVDIYGKRCRAVIQPNQALWDAHNLRIKS